MTTATGPIGLEWWHPHRGEQLAARATVEAPESRQSPVPFGALVAFTSIQLLAPQTLFPALAPLRPALLAATLALVAHVYDCFVRRRPLLNLDAPNLLSMALVGWAALTVPFSFWPGGSISLLRDLYLKALVIFWLLGSVLTTRTRLRSMCWLLTLLMIPLGVTAIRNFVNGDYVAGDFVADQTLKRIIGYEAPLTQNPNDLALMLNVGLPLGIGLLLSSERPLARLFLAAVLGLDAAAVVLTFSRGGFLSLATTAVIYLVHLGRRGRWAWSVAALVLVLGVLPFLPQGYADRLATISEIDSDPTRSAQLRWVDMVEAVHFVFDNPLIGAGFGMNMLALNDIRGLAWKEVHNTYLQYGMDLAFPGLLLFLSLFFCCLRNVGLVKTRSPDRAARGELYCIAESVQASLLMFAVAAMFHPVAYQFYFFYLAGLAVAARTVCETETGGRIGSDSGPSVRH